MENVEYQYYDKIQYDTITAPSMMRLVDKLKVKGLEGWDVVYIDDSGSPISCIVKRKLKTL
ncbi:MAG: hypothetical protein J6D03_03280 [Clostridia bacterium]|nr:hypothetical protein [Clostridia bacterium]